MVRNCERLEIDLPEYPKAKDYKGFMMWYYDFCEVLNDFQKTNKMTDAELCACLYGFASNLEDDEEKAFKEKHIYLQFRSVDIETPRKIGEFLIYWNMEK